MKKNLKALDQYCSVSILGLNVQLKLLPPAIILFVITIVILIHEFFSK